MATKSNTIKKDIVLKALVNSLGIVTDACKEAKINRATYYKWLKSDAEFKAASDDVIEVAIDFAESKLFQKMNGVEVEKYNSQGEPVIYSIPPSDTALIFYLKTKGKKRGYIERTEHDFSGFDKVIVSGKEPE